MGVLNAARGTRRSTLLAAILEGARRPAPLSTIPWASSALAREPRRSVPLVRVLELSRRPLPPAAVLHLHLVMRGLLSGV
jgi:hypothetical protein